MKPQFDLDLLIEKARNKVNECREEWHSARVAMLNSLQSSRDKQIPSNYWTPEYRLRSKYLLACQFLQSLEEIRKEEEEEKNDL